MIKEKDSVCTFGIALANCLRQKKYDAAIDYFRTIYSMLDPMYHYDHSLGEAESSQGNYEAALDYYQTSVKHHIHAKTNFIENQNSAVETFKIKDIEKKGNPRKNIPKVMVGHF